mgnify:CR=1 FL=1
MSDENATPDNGQDVPATATNDIPENPPQGGQPEPQGQPEGQQPEGQQNATGGAETPPETYVLDLPDYPGSPEELQFVTEMAQKSGLPAEAASTFLQRAANYQQILHEKTVEAWAEASRNDPELGGAQFDANLAVAKRGYNMFASDELKGILEETGYGNHPAVLRLFHQIGKLLGEDNIVGGGRSRQQTAQDFYSQSNMNP